MSEDLNKQDGYLIMEWGLYYRPNSRGYTGIRDNAGRYTLAEAMEHADTFADVTFIHESEAEEFSSACDDDLARDHLRTQITDLRQRLQAAEERADHFKGLADEHALFDAETDLAFKDLDAQISDLTQGNDRMRKALERIERWFGEFPETGRTCDDGSPMSYAAAFGSNGERDYMREVARAALKTEGA